MAVIIGGREFDFERRVAVMGIVNRTPDSFFDDGATFRPRPGGRGRARGGDGGR